MSERHWVKAGMSKSALYHDFPSKDALVDAILAGLLAEERAALAKVAASAAPGAIFSAIVGGLVHSAKR